MDDLKSVTVDYLRELARKHLGRGHSRLKTKAQLLGALVIAVPALAKLARLAQKKKAASSEREGAARKPAVEGRKPAVTQERKSETEPKAPAGGAHQAAEPTPPPPPTTKPAHVVNFPPRPRPPGRAPEPEPPYESEDTPPPDVPPPGEPEDTAPTPPPSAEHPAEPLVEGFFVARVMGVEEARDHHLTEEEGRQDSIGWRGFEENLGELPLDYSDDVAVALPRDPHSLYVLWDFSPAARNRALEGLEAPRAVLRVYDGEALVREEDFALESRSYYLDGLPSGGPYRVEAHFVGRDGRSRRIGQASSRIVLPAEGPSSDTSVHFLHVPPPAPVEPPAPALASTPGPALLPPIEPLAPAPPPAEERTYVTWHRVPLPGSAGFQEVPEVHVERLGPGLPAPQHLPAHLALPPRPPESSEQHAPAAPEVLELPSGVAGPAGRRYLERPSRPPGASEQRYLEVRSAPPQPAAPEAPAPTERRYLQVPRPPGASEQRYLEEQAWQGAGAPGPSVQPGGRPGAAPQPRRYLEVRRAEGSSEQTAWTPPPSGRGR